MTVREVDRLADRLDRGDDPWAPDGPQSSTDWDECAAAWREVARRREGESYHAGHLLDEAVVRAQRYETALRLVLDEIEVLVDRGELSGEILIRAQEAEAVLTSPIERLNTREIRDAMDGAAPYHELCGQRHWNACPTLWGGGQ